MILLDEPSPVFVGTSHLIPLIIIAFAALILLFLIFYFRKRNEKK